MENVPDSQQPAVHHHRLEAIERMLERHNETLQENTVCQRETSVALRFFSETLERHAKKLESAVVCEVRIEALEKRVEVLEAASRNETADANFIRHARRFWPLVLALLALFHPALYAQLTGAVGVPQPPAGPTLTLPPALPQSVPPPHS